MGAFAPVDQYVSEILNNFLNPPLLPYVMASTSMVCLGKATWAVLPQRL